MVAALQDKAYLVSDLEDLAILEDPDDNPILATALKVEADYLITGNLVDFRNAPESINLVSPGDFLAIMDSA